MRLYKVIINALKLVFINMYKIFLNFWLKIALLAGAVAVIIILAFSYNSANPASAKIGGDMIYPEFTRSDTTFFNGLTPESAEPKPNDSMRFMLELLAEGTQAYDTTYSVTTQFQDINGNGLPDFLYFKQHSGGGNTYRYYAVFINNGGTFEQTYVCHHSTFHKKYYGDCAQQ